MAQEKATINDNKKEWNPPKLTVLDIDTSTAGVPIGNAALDGVYS